MGEARAKKRAHHDLLLKHPYCIYCGAAAATVEHMPPVVIFWNKQRPKGLEFPSCAPCNSATRLTETAIAVIARASPEPATEAQESDLKRLLDAVENNAPGFLQELQVGMAVDEPTHRNLRIPEDAGLMRVNGPIVSRHMQIFGAKFGFAMHFEATGHRVPDEGGVQSTWFSNVQAANGGLPEELFEMLPGGEPRTLKQGKKEVSGQFGYQWVLTEEGDHALFYGVFHDAFAIAAVSAKDRSVFLDKHADRYPVFVPGTFRKEP